MVCLELPREVCLKRATQRQGHEGGLNPQTAPRVVNTMSSQLRPPTAAEAFASVMARFWPPYPPLLSPGDHALCRLLLIVGACPFLQFLATGTHSYSSAHRDREVTVRMHVNRGYRRIRGGREGASAGGA